MLNIKQVGLAEWLKCPLSHLGVAGTIPGHNNLRGMCGPCKIVYDHWYEAGFFSRWEFMSVHLFGDFSGRFSVVPVRAEQHKGYATDRVPSSVAWSQKAWLLGHGKFGHLIDRLHQKAPRMYFTFTFGFCIFLGSLVMCSGLLLMLLFCLCDQNNCVISRVGKSGVLC